MTKTKSLSDHFHDVQQEEYLAPRPLSRLTYKIMSLNVIAVIVLLMGASYLDQYRKDLTSAETEILSVETRLYAAVLSQGFDKEQALSSDRASPLINAFTQQKQQSIRLFDREGKVVSAASSDAQKETLPSETFIEKGFSLLIDMVSVEFRLPDYPATTDSAFSLPDAPDALLDGAASLSAWRTPDGGLLLSSSAPIMKNGKIIGAVLVTRGDTRIESMFASTRLDILRLVLVSLVFTTSLSLYLAGIIGHPLRKLALAAEKLRLSQGKYTEIPDMSDRQDEIGELSHSLRAMTEFLQHRLNATERFAADVAHELKNPLTSMRSAAETLSRVDNEDDRNKLTQVILHDLQRMDRLITDISQASRLDAELSRDIFEPIDLRDVFLPLIDAWDKPLHREGRSLASTHNIRFIGLDKPVVVMGHAGRLAQVFQNLIGNALSFSPEDKPVRLSVESNNDRIKIVIEDDGPGIPENRLEKIFERFYSERPAGESFGSHSGLGLSISRQIVTAHGGTIHAENCRDENGKTSGARFIVRLKALTT